MNTQERDVLLAALDWYDNQASSKAQLHERLLAAVDAWVLRDPKPQNSDEYRARANALKAKPTENPNA